MSTPEIPTDAEVTAATPAPETPAPIEVAAVSGPALDAAPEIAAETAVEETAAAPSPAKTPDMSPAECARQLRERFPALFDGPARPLKLRIQADIKERAPGVFSRATLSAFLRRHTNTTAYLVALTKAASRTDLDGQPAGDISDEHRTVAQQELDRRRALHQERRAQEAKQQRESRRGAAPQGEAAAGEPAREPREPREPREARPPRAPRPPRGEGRPPREARDSREPRAPGSRPPRQDRDAQPRPPRGERPERQDRPARPPRDEAARAAAAPVRQEAPVERVQDDPQRRERAQLLRDFERSSLKRSSFCVLRGVPEDQLDVLLEQARREAAEAPARAPQREEQGERRPGGPGRPPRR
ncbi:ProQ/FINO family protein [Sphaerotilus uruguayifluvii]|uniref:SRNA-binding protein n=1 Tax=Sphaerotilus uruguayifluvii TaxID=2735897 RepID=A0ABX2FX24_9BURK|nr:ProQ/FINO family protein [Leptothrix sp. C29]NRT54512.1 sRNA-binding protein [Leptothrix sp. C29]